MFKNLYCSAVPCLLLAQCVGTIKVMPEYKNIDVEKSRLGIILLKENMMIKNRSDITGYPGDGEAKEVFHDFFTEQFKEFAVEHGKFGEVKIVNGCDTSGFTMSTQYLSADDSVKVRLPPKNACMADSVPYLLLLDNISISRERNAGKTVVTVGYNGTMIPRKVGAFDNLILTGTFMLWDTFAGKIVSFGKIHEKSDVLTGMTKQTWITAVERISSQIFVNTPYGMPSVPAVE